MNFPGISLNSGYKWRKQRHFAAFHLKAFAEGKNALELHIQQECVSLCQTFEEEQGVVLYLPLFLVLFYNYFGILAWNYIQWCQ